MVPMRTVVIALLAVLAMAGCNNGPPAAPSITRFTCFPGIVPFGGGSVTVTWMVSGATSVSINNEPVSPPTGGSVTDQVTVATTFTLLATNFGGQSTAMCRVSVGIPPPVINSFTVTPSTLEAGGGDVTFAWNVTGADSLTIEPNVGTVTPTDAGDATGLVSVSTMFVLTATNDGGSTSADAGVVVLAAQPMVNVTGTVVDNNGQPIAGETVLISTSDGGFSQTAVSAADGTFNVPNVPTPYDATVIQTTQAIEYQGLTRADPFLSAFVYLTNNRGASISGQFIGGLYPETAAYDTVFLFSSPQATVNLKDQTSGSYTSLPVKWPGPVSTTGTLYALQIHNSANLPADYPGYGTLGGVTLADTGTVSGLDVNLGSAPLPTGMLTGTVSAPVGYTVAGKTMSLLADADAGLTLSLLYDPSPGATFSYVAPVISNTDLIVSASATSAAGEYSAVQAADLSATSQNVALIIPAAPTLITPSDLATGVDAGTPFSWSIYPQGVYELEVYSTSGPTFYVITAATSVTIPDLAGLPLPATTGYSWFILGLAPVSTVDVLANPGGINKLSFDLNASFSATRTFTTGP